MTDNEIIKALKCCKDIGGCFVCPLYTTDGNRCTETVIVAALDLIQRQQKRMDRIVERLERHAYETANWMCGGTMKAVELTDAIEIVKGEQ